MSSSSLTAKVKPPTCKVCRQRKVRCDGEEPCGPCSRGRKTFNCEYLDPSAATAVELPKGAACIPCWKRKRKCDGNRPCQTCKNTTQPDACQYRDKVPRREPQAGDDDNRISISDETSRSSLSSPTVSASTSEQDHSSLEVVENRSLTNALDTHICQKADRAAELSSVRNLFLDQSWEYGLNISADKRAAIARGDTSGTLVHPALTAVCELLGYVLASQVESADYAYLEGHWAARETAQLDRTLLLLDGPGDSAPDPVTRVQVYKLLAVYCVRREKVHGYQEYLGHAANVALRHQALLGLDDSMPPSVIGAGLPQGPVEEGRSALAHLVYLEVAGRILRKRSPHLPAVMIAKFGRLAGCHSEETELNFLRAMTVIHFDESQQLVAEWNTVESDGMVGSEWAERWIALSKRLHAHLLTLRSTITGHDHAHKVVVLLLQSCMVVTLAGMAILHAVFAPFQAFAFKKHSSIINAIALISRSFAPEDHQHFDCTLGLCWDIASHEISKPTEPPPQWKVCFANAVFLGHDEPLELDLCTGLTVDATEALQMIDHPLEFAEFASLSL
ncbi:hypothetical protein DFH06DRAFT_1214999 [Mycena polygramma]|nr:hypothetical protein DFH06DRAFT_1214999 [Mycena polygramma]